MQSMRFFLSISPFLRGGGLLLVILLAAQNASAATISTLFEANTSSSIGGAAVYFNLTVGKRDITITGLKTNVRAFARNTRSFPGFRVDIRDGAALGKEFDQSGWTTASEGTVTVVPGTRNGLNQRSPVALKSNIVLKAGRTYGFRLITPSNVQHNYTGRSRMQLRYENADLTLDFGSASNEPLATGPSVFAFSPRVWNGEIEYSVVPLPAAAWLFISALGGLLAMRRKPGACARLA